MLHLICNAVNQIRFGKVMEVKALGATSSMIYKEERRDSRIIGRLRVIQELKLDVKRQRGKQGPSVIMLT